MWIVKLTEYNTSKTLCCLNIEWAASSPLYELFFFFSTSHFVHYKSSNSTSFLFNLKKKYTWILKIQDITYLFPPCPGGRMRPCNKRRHLRRSLATTCASLHMYHSNSCQLSLFLQMFSDPPFFSFSSGV